MEYAMKLVELTIEEMVKKVLEKKETLTHWQERFLDTFLKYKHEDYPQEIQDKRLQRLAVLAGGQFQIVKK
jgi:hypothetical protein